MAVGRKGDGGALLRDEGHRPLLTPSGWAGESMVASVGMTRLEAGHGAGCTMRSGVVPREVCLEDKARSGAEAAGVGQGRTSRADRIPSGGGEFAGETRLLTRKCSSSCFQWPSAAPSAWCQRAQQ